MNSNNLACPASPVHIRPIRSDYRNHRFGGDSRAGAGQKNKCPRVAGPPHRKCTEIPKSILRKKPTWGSVNPIGIRSCYDEGKRCAETLFFDYFRQWQVDIKVIRIFNTYGPQMHPADGRVVSNFIMQALQNQDITMYGTGKQTRSFCYVSDLVEGMVRMMDSEPCFQGPVNLGNPVEFTMLELAQEILKQTKSSSQIIFQPLPQDDPCQRQPDISLAGRRLDWRPAISLAEGLKPTIEWFQQVLNRT